MIQNSALATRLIAAGLLLVFPVIDACAIVPRDAVYIHCHNEGGDFRISELNHAVAKYSERFGEYRPVCVDCNVMQWGNVIALDDGEHVSVLIDRLKGYISVRRRDEGEEGEGDVRPFRGLCARGQMVAPDHAAPAPRRAF